jgi:hypothetical protein
MADDDAAVAMDSVQVVSDPSNSAVDVGGYFLFN